MRNIIFFLMIFALFISLLCCNIEPGGTETGTGGSIETGAGGSKNHAPTVEIEGGNLLLRNGIVHTVTTISNDPDGDSLTQQWYIDDVLQLGEKNSSFNFSETPSDDTLYTIKTIVSDGELTAEDSISINIFNDTPDTSNPEDIGSVSGDVGEDAITYENSGEKLLKVLVSENDGGIELRNLRVSCQLTPPATGNYDMVVFWDSNCTQEIGRSEKSGSSIEELNINWEDNLGFDDSRDIYIWIRCNMAYGDDNWSLTVRGNKDIVSETPDTSNPEDIGSVSGDVGEDTITYENSGEKLLKVLVSENDSQWFLPKALRVSCQLTPPATGNYDMVVFWDSNCTQEIGRSEKSGSSIEELNINWEDNLGFDDSRDIYIWIRCNMAYGDDNWTFTVRGNHQF